MATLAKLSDASYATLTQLAIGDLIPVISDPGGTPATAKIAIENLRHYVNVKDYGAVGDGVADDTVAIQAAITAGAGKVVYFPVGTYKLTAALTVSADDTILYANGNATLTLAAATNTNMVNLATNLDRCTIDGLRFDGNGANQTAGTLRMILASTGSTDLTIRNCHFEDQRVGGTCFYYSGAKSSCARLRFLNNTYGALCRGAITAIGVDDFVVDGFTAAQGQGNIQWGGGSRALITNGIQYAASHTAVSGEQQMVVISGDAAVHDEKTDTTDWEVSNWTIINGYGDCLWIGPSSRGRVTSCRIRTEGDVTSADCCSSLNGSDDVIYSGCEFSYAGSAGIAIDRSPTVFLSLTDIYYTSGTTIKSDTGGFTTAMVGMGIYLDTGTHFYDGWYTIATRVSTNEVTLNAAPASEDTTDHKNAVGGVTEGSHRISIIGCLIHNCGTRSDIAGYKSGITIFPLSENVMIDGCQIYSNTEYPVYNVNGAGVTGITVRNLRAWSNGTSDIPTIAGTLGMTRSVSDSITSGAVITSGAQATAGTWTGTFLDHSAGAGRLVVKGADATSVGTFALHVMEADAGNDYTALSVSNVGVVTMAHGIRQSSTIGLVTKTVKMTIGYVGCTTTDFAWATAGDHVAQNLDLGAIVPANARVIDVCVKCTETPTGAPPIEMLITVGNASAGNQFIAQTSCKTAGVAIAGAAGSSPFAAIDNAASHVWVQGDPDANWSAMNAAGQWRVTVTYIDNEAME